MTDNMPDVLKKICKTKQGEIQSLRKRQENEWYEQIERQSSARGFREALQARPEVALIAEVKKASPSAGVIREDFEPVEIARGYETGGARCLSVLTDETYFKGSVDYLEKVRQAVQIPVLRKDFILDKYQILEARAAGADCILLIVAALDKKQLGDLQTEAKGLGMDCLVEVHDERELEIAVSSGASLVGINNRNLRTFEVDLRTTLDLAPQLPAGVVCVAESGIQSRSDVVRMKDHGVDAILVGESLMRSDDIGQATRQLSDV